MAQISRNPGRLAPIVLCAALVALFCAASAEAAFPGRDGRIAATAYGFEGGAFSRLYVGGPKGGMQRLGTGGMAASLPAWSPDGRSIAFVGIPPHAENGSLYVMDYDGSRLRRVAGAQSGVSAPAWSSAGTKIGYLGCPSGCSSAFSIGLDASRPSRIAGIHPFFTISWSPDGSKLAYDSEDSPIHVSAADGSGTVDVPGTLGQGPDWAPRGDELVYQGTETTARGLYVTAPDGTGLKRLTDDQEDLNPAWSPSGRRLVFVRGEALFTVGADGTHPKRLTRGFPYYGSPDWQPIAAPACPSVSVVEVHGSRRRSDAGRRPRAFARGLLGELRTSAAPMPLAYGAGTFSWHKPGRRYIDGVRGGVKRLRARLLSDPCNSVTRYVLAGSGQSAQVVGDMLAGHLSRDVRRRVVVAVLFADPKSKHGILGARKSRIPKGTRVFSLCARGEPICRAHPRGSAHQPRGGRGRQARDAARRVAKLLE